MEENHVPAVVIVARIFVPVRKMNGRICLTVVHTNGVHYCDIWYCSCDGSKGSQMQLLRAGLFPATTRDCRTAFTFHDLDDFLLDNVESGTTAMNYYSKLHRVTSNAFLHLVPDRYRELLRLSQAWRHLKLLKWKGFHAGACDPGLGDLVLFCPACPQPGINILPEDNIDMSDYKWKYSQVIVVDGNFKAEYMASKNTDSECWLMDGHGYMMGSQRYKAYLTGTETRVTRSNCSNHHVVNQASANRGHLESTGIGGCACARHGCFIPHVMVDFQKGEQ
ncbi:hypothetical protein J3A83DRAFT_4364796 [Scleroderma citrinum]